MSNFQGKTVFITGGTSGIGKATAKEFIDRGAKVLFTSRKQENVNETEKELGPQAKGFVNDAGNWQDIEKLEGQLREHTDKVDVLFVNAGFGGFSPVNEVTQEHWDDQFNVLAKGAFFTAQKTLPLMHDKSSIVFNASVVTDMAMEGGSVYSAAKAAVKHISRSYAQELKGKGIRVNSVSPGPIGTNFFNEAGLSEEEQQQMGEQIKSQVPLDRFGEPVEIAKTVAFLASEDASYITGHDIQVDGGMVQL